MLLTKIAILILLVIVFVQDMRSRSVYWVLFPCLVFLFVLIKLLEHRPFADALQPTLINLAFLAVQFLVLSVYFSIKNARWVNITAGMVGLGDILFLVAVAFYVSFLNFLLFYVFSLVGVLLVWLIWQGLSSLKGKHIPLAGLQALFLGLFLTTDWWISPFNSTSDNWLISFMTR